MPRVSMQSEYNTQQHTAPPIHTTEPLQSHHYGSPTSFKGWAHISFENEAAGRRPNGDGGSDGDDSISWSTSVVLST